MLTALNLTNEEDGKVQLLHEVAQASFTHATMQQAQRFVYVVASGSHQLGATLCWPWRRACKHAIYPQICHLLLKKHHMRHGWSYR